MSADDQIFLVDGQCVPFKHHPQTLHGTKTKMAQPRVQLTEYHAKRLDLQIIDESSCDVSKIIFPNGNVNYVLMSRKDSICSSLRSLHICMSRREAMLEEFLSNLERRNYVKDDLGGGRYVASGYGNMGRNVPQSIRPPDQPALRKCLTFNEHHRLGEIVGEIFSHVAECISLHCDDVYEENKTLMRTNPQVTWPPLEYQNPVWNWMSTQFIVRRWGPGLRTHQLPLKDSLVAAHVDHSDHDSYTFHCYKSGGGKDCNGGPVAGTDLAIFEHSQGGTGYRVKTCIKDTVVVVVLRSKRQLHGVIESDNSFVEDELAWSTRIIPFIPQGVYNWMTRHPLDKPYSNIP